MGKLARFTTVAALTLVCAKALAAPECTQAPKDKWMPEKYMKAELEEQGYKIKRFTEEGDAPHEIAGCIALGLAVARLVWGFTGTHYARFSQFVPRPSALLSYMMAMVKGREARFLGHNPAGAFMVLALLVTVLPASVSGWMLTTDAYFGEEWVEALHESMSNPLMGLVGLHVGT